MSRIYNNGYEIEYPNEMAYAGMPTIVSITNATEYNGASVTIMVGDEFYSEVRTIYNGRATFDISRYMQLAFLGKELGVQYGDRQVQKSELAQDVRVVVELTNSQGEGHTALDFDIKALYGYIAFGQANGGKRNRKLFANYPQTFDFYLTPNSEITISYNGGTEEEVAFANNIDKISQVSVELSRWRSVPEEAKTAVLSAKYTQMLNGDIENESVDSAYHLTIDRSKSGVFVRWIDHFGQWCYYLFRPTAQTYAVKEQRTWLNGELRDGVAPVRGVVQSSDFSQQQFSQQQTLAIGAKLVDAETFDFLLSLTNSPRVEVMQNAEAYQYDNTTAPIWERVNIVAGSYARTSAKLQDFLVTIARTPNKTQML